jgi:hypothetical protein
MPLTWSLPPSVGLPTIRLRMRPQDRMRGTWRYEARFVTNLEPIPGTPPLSLLVSVQVSAGGPSCPTLRHNHLVRPSDSPS